jgi:hypothetical protein
MTCFKLIQSVNKMWFKDHIPEPGLILAGNIPPGDLYIHLLFLPNIYMVH